MPDRVLASTKFLRLIDREGWSFVERSNARGVVTIVALTRERKIVFVDQYRAPMAASVIELPAGLVGDDADLADEDVAAAARRELREETGYEAGRVELLASCPTSPGLTNEIASFLLATDLTRVGNGGGTIDEAITVHEVSFVDADRWLHERQREGRLVAAKVYAGLWLARQAQGGRY